MADHEQATADVTMAAGDETWHLETDADALVDELSDILTTLEDQPSNVRLLRRQVDLMTQLGMLSEAAEASTRLVDIVMPNEDFWLGLIDATIQSAPKPLTLDGFVDVLEKFDRAEKDYLSLAVLIRHVEFIVLCSRHLSPGLATSDGEPEQTVDEDVVAFLTHATTRGMLIDIVDKSQGILTQSHLVWQPYLDWEMTVKDDLAEIHDVFIKRLQTCHSTIDETSSAYSSFCSQYCPEEYEARLVQATAASQKAKHQWSGEKRYGQTREDLEQALAYSPDSASQAQAFLTYIDWETDPRAKHPKSDRAPKTDPVLVRAVLERTIVAYATAAATSETAVYAAEKALAKLSKKSDELATSQHGLKIAQDAHRAYKEGEAMIWARYVGWLDENAATEDVVETATRATRACPRSGVAWCNLLVNMESSGAALDALQAVVEKAQDLVAEVDGPVKDLVDVVLCHAAILNRAVPVEDDVEGHPVLTCLLNGLEQVLKIQKTGDPSLRIEKYLLDWVENKAPLLLPEALTALDANKARASSYQMVLLRSAVEVRMGETESARKTFIAAIQKADLDWPEAVYEAFLQFENVHGTIETLRSTLKRVETEQTKVAKRREKEQQQYAERYPAAALETQVAETGAETMAQAAPATVPTGNAAEPETESHLKRDREHTTVLVTGLKRGTDASRLESFFEECGRAKEVTILSDDKHDTDSALVEFRSVDAIPGALGKDHKKLDGAEVAVMMLWRSTLFVTNFPRDMDDVALREMFSQYGRVLQTRWPSRKFAGSRRFCYITMESSAAAQEALVLNGFANTGGFPLTVAISDPSVKIKRSDASNAILFVGGLNAKTTESELRGLFEAHGQVLSVKLGWDAEKRICKGFAFVEMSSEAEAKASIALHGTQFHGRYLKVQVSDPNHANKKSDNPRHDPRAAAERRARTVFLHNLPQGTQEGLLQQELEKIVPVKRLELFEKTLHAVVELEAQADAGLLLLRSEPFVFNGNTITITGQEERQARPAPQAAAPAAGPSSSLAFAPRAARRPGKTIGKGRQAPTTDKALSAAGVTAAPVSRGQDDFRLLVAAKNEQRKEKLDNAVQKAETGVKRGQEDGDDHESKRAKVD